MSAMPLPVEFQPTLPVAMPVEDSMAFLRRAINAPDKGELVDMIRKEIIDYNVLNKIELKKDEVTKTLPDEARHYLFPEILTCVNANIPTALVGPAGSGKSTVCQQVAVALELPYFLQNSVTGTHELSGYMDAHGKYNGTAFRTAFEHGGLILVDEVDTSDAGALKWINTALANGHAMFPDQPQPVNRHKDFRILIAANTYGNGADRLYVGANQLDASTLDRFVFFDFGYDEKLELMLCGGHVKWAERVQALRKAAAEQKARIVISPRATLNGAKLLAAGWPQNVLEERIIWKGLDAELKARILESMDPQPEKIVSEKDQNKSKKKRWT